MSSTIPPKKRWLESFDSASKKGRLDSTTLFHLDQALLIRIAALLPLNAGAVLAQVDKRLYDVICIYRAQESGYKGTDPAEARKRIENLCLRILIFQEQDQKTRFGLGVHLQFFQTHDRVDARNLPPLVPQFRSSLDFKNHKYLSIHPLELLLDNCKKMKLEKICTLFLLNFSYYLFPETPWIDFFEVESSWSQVTPTNKSTELTLLFHALSLAYYFKRPKLIQILINKGAPLNKLPYMSSLPHPFKLDGSLPTPLRSVIEQGDQKQIDFLLSKGVKVTGEDLLPVINTQERTVNIPLLNYLLTHCKKPLFDFSWNQNTLWNKVVLIESQEALELLTQHGYPIEPSDVLKLMLQFMRKRIEFDKGCDDPFSQFYLNLLLEKKPDINGFCDRNTTLLQEAVKKKSLVWTSWLLEKGAEVDKPQDHPPLSLLCRTAAPSPQDLDLIRLLLSFGAQPLTEKISSPYRCAQNFNAQEILEIFDEHLTSTTSDTLEKIAEN